jgi:hypothetical protein
MNRVPEILYLGQNHKEYVMKEAVTYIKSLGTDKTDVTPMRSDG